MSSVTRKLFYLPCNVIFQGRKCVLRRETNGTNRNRPGKDFTVKNREEGQVTDDKKGDFTENAKKRGQKMQ